MIARSLILAVCAAILSPGWSRAQEKPSAADGAAADHEMYEHIEILRRILDRKLDSFYPSHSGLGMAMGMGKGMSPMGGSMGFGGMGGMHGGMSGMQGGMMNSGGMMGFGPSQMAKGRGVGSGFSMAGMAAKNPFGSSKRTLEGVYLKGRGVVYTVTVPSLQASAKVEKTGRSANDWDSVRGEIHGKKGTAKKPDAGKKIGLREVLLKVLADNGHHFSRLGANESLTLVVTVRGENKFSFPGMSKGTMGSMGGKTAAGGWAFSFSTPGKMHDFALLGDLHLKQGKYEDAIAVFEKAEKSATDAKQKAALHGKLAQAYLMLEKNEKARAHLDQAISLVKEATNAKHKSTPTAKAKTAALPMKMIITAPKKLLDRAGEGKIKFDEFCRQAKVETLHLGSKTRSE